MSTTTTERRWVRDSAGHKLPVTVTPDGREVVLYHQDGRTFSYPVDCGRFQEVSR